MAWNIIDGQKGHKVNISAPQNVDIIHKIKSFEYLPKNVARQRSIKHICLKISPNQQLLTLYNQIPISGKCQQKKPTIHDLPSSSLKIIQKFVPLERTKKWRLLHCLHISDPNTMKDQNSVESEVLNKGFIREFQRHKE